MMLLLPPANGKRTANLGPIEDFAFLATAATMWTLWARGNLAFAGGSKSIMVSSVAKHVSRI